MPNPNSEDEKAKFSTGFLKVTPAHDPDDWAIGQRHKLEVINVMAPDGSISDKFGWTDWEQIKNPDAENLIGMDRFEAREAIVEWFSEEGLLEEIRPYAHEVGHSYRSHVPIEPYLSDQWYIAVKKPIDHLEKKFGKGMIDGTDVPVNSLAGLALKPLIGWPTEIHPRTLRQNISGLARKPPRLANLQTTLVGTSNTGLVKSRQAKKPLRITEHSASIVETEQGPVTYACVKPGFEKLEQAIVSEGWVRDPDVLDTWFSSAFGLSARWAGPMNRRY